MAGLLWKDLLYIKKIWKTIALFSIFFAVFGFIQGDFSNLLFLYIIIEGNFSMLPFTYDNYSKWNSYQYAFPVSKKTVVCSRYLFGMVLFGSCLFLGILVIVLHEIEVILTGATKVPIGIDYISANLLPAFFVPIIQSVSFPFLYYFGAEKGKVYIVCSISALAAIITILGIQIRYSLPYYMTYHFVLACVAVVTVILYSLSLLLSIWIEERK